MGFTPRAEVRTRVPVFQLLVAGQVPAVAYFALKWLQPDAVRGLTLAATRPTAAVHTTGRA